MQIEFAIYYKELLSVYSLSKIGDWKLGRLVPDRYIS